MFTSITLLALILLSYTTFALADDSIKNTIYIITNAERPSLGRPGLTPVGLQRAIDCIPNIFTQFDIGLIVICTPDPASGACLPVQATVDPLANSTGLIPDASCGTGEDVDDDCVGDLLTAYAKKSTKPVLIVWDAEEMDTLLENLDIDFPDDDDDGDDDNDDDDDPEDEVGAFPDVILSSINGLVVSQVSMNCTGIDGPAPGSF